MNKTLFKIFFLFLLLPSCSFAQIRELPFYLQQAKQNSPLLHDYQNQIQSLGLDSRKTRAGYGPQVLANGDLMYAPTFHHWGYDPAITNGQNISVLMAVSKQIIGKNNLQAKLDNLTLQKQITGNQMKLSGKKLEQNVTQQYLICYGDQLQLNLSDEIFSLLQNEDEALKKLTQASVFKQTDYLTFKVALQQQKLTMEQIKTQLLNDFSTLNYICGIEDSTLENIMPPDLQPITIEPFEQSLYAESFQADSLKNVNDAKIINMDYRPKISAFADGGYQSALPAQAYRNWGMSVGLNFSLPIYDGHQKKMALMQNKIKADSRAKYRDFAQQQYQQQIVQLEQQIRQYQKIKLAAKQQTIYAKTLVEANKKQLTTGDVRMTDYLLSITNYLNLRVALIQNEITSFSLINQLNHLILK